MSKPLPPQTPRPSPLPVTVEDYSDESDTDVDWANEVIDSVRNLHQLVSSSAPPSISSSPSSSPSSTPSSVSISSAPPSSLPTSPRTASELLWPHGPRVSSLTEVPYRSVRETKSEQRKKRATNLRKRRKGVIEPTWKPVSAPPKKEAPPPQQEAVKIDKILVRLRLPKAEEKLTNGTHTCSFVCNQDATCGELLDLAVAKLRTVRPPSAPRADRTDFFISTDKVRRHRIRDEITLHTIMFPPVNNNDIYEKRKNSLDLSSSHAFEDDDRHLPHSSSSSSSSSASASSSSASASASSASSVSASASSFFASSSLVAASYEMPSSPVFPFYDAPNGGASPPSNLLTLFLVNDYTRHDHTQDIVPGADDPDVRG